MAHVEKFSKGALGHMLSHYDRSKNVGDNISPERTHLNYNLAPHDRNQLEFIQKRLTEVHCLNRKDVNVMCTWVVTLPKDFEGSDKRFFHETYRFLANRYGKENVISAWVHMDEATPHMHFAFVPVVWDEKKGYEKVSAKELISKKELKVFHAELQEDLEGMLGRKVSILNEATKDGNKSILELKKNSLRQEISKAELKVDSLRQEISKLEKKKDTLTTAEVQAINGKKTLLGGLKGVSYEEFQALKKTASKVDLLEKKLSEATASARQAEQRAAEAERNSGKVSMKTQMELASLKAENSKMSNRLKTLSEFVEKYLPDEFRHQNRAQKRTPNVEL